MNKIKIQVGVSDEHKRDFLSRCLAFILRKDYTHIFIVYKDRMYHAIERGVCDDCWIEYQKTHHIRGLKEVQLNCDEETFFKHYEMLKGRSYTYSQALAFIPILGKLFDNDRKRMWCSEYVGIALSDLAGRWEFADADKLTPIMFERI